MFSLFRVLYSFKSIFTAIAVVIAHLSTFYNRLLETTRGAKMSRIAKCLWIKKNISIATTIGAAAAFEYLINSISSVTSNYCKVVNGSNAVHQFKASTTSYRFDTLVQMCHELFSFLTVNVTATMHIVCTFLSRFSSSNLLCRLYVSEQRITANVVDEVSSLICKKKVSIYWKIKLFDPV